MRASDVPIVPGYGYVDASLLDLLKRAFIADRSSWIDLPIGPGVYVVYLPNPEHFDVSTNTGAAVYALSTSIEFLKVKWAQINKKLATDILYIGKGDSLRKRIRLLARFGAGRADNHKGGEWLWQVVPLAQARIKIVCCPSGKQVPFEKCLLDLFHEQHGNWPLANRKGGDGIDTWCPSS